MSEEKTQQAQEGQGKVVINFLELTTSKRDEVVAALAELRQNSGAAVGSEAAKAQVYIAVDQVFGPTLKTWQQQISAALQSGKPSIMVIPGIAKDLPGEVVDELKTRLLSSAQILGMPLLNHLWKKFENLDEKTLGEPAPGQPLVELKLQIFLDEEEGVVKLQGILTTPKTNNQLTLSMKVALDDDDETDSEADGEEVDLCPGC